MGGPEVEADMDEEEEDEEEEEEENEDEEVTTCCLSSSSVGPCSSTSLLGDLSSCRLDDFDDDRVPYPGASAASRDLRFVILSSSWATKCCHFFTSANATPTTFCDFEVFVFFRRRFSLWKSISWSLAMSFFLLNLY